MRVRCLVAFHLTLALVGVAAASARADQNYHVSGKDSFTVGASDLRGDIAYDGTETLAVQHSATASRYSARVRYIRIDQGARSEVRASFVALMLPSGEQIDADDRDPDYLAILNQPFAVQLDASTLHDLDHLQGAVPFTFPSPITNSTLAGALRHAGDALVDSDRTLGIVFSAAGPMHGPLPGRPSEILTGTIKMSGTAYYNQKTALLDALDDTMTITGTLQSAGGTSEPILITYRRTIRKTTPVALKEADR
jgi:hypothetical protein